MFGWHLRAARGTCACSGLSTRSNITGMRQAACRCARARTHVRRTPCDTRTYERIPLALTPRNTLANTHAMRARASPARGGAHGRRPHAARTTPARTQNEPTGARTHAWTRTPARPHASTHGTNACTNAGCARRDKHTHDERTNKPTSQQADQPNCAERMHTRHACAHNTRTHARCKTQQFRLSVCSLTCC